MIKNAIERILALAPPTIETIDERPYSNQALFPIKPPLAEALTIHTLTGVVDYLEGPGNQDIAPGTVFLQVVSHKEVKLLSTIIPLFKQREELLIATPPDSRGFPFGSWMDPESFIIALQAMFVPDETTTNLLVLVSSIKEEAIKTSGDDGVSQIVTARAGIVLVTEVKVPNPVTLRPYRTFMEVTQPAISCVFRLRQGPMLSLHEADGGQWRLEAIQAIKQYLSERLPDISVIA